MELKTDNQIAVERPKPLTWLRVTVAYLLIPLLLLLCGWDVDWWEAWVFSLLIVGAGLVGRIWAERRHPGLLTERERALTEEGGTQVGRTAREKGGTDGPHRPVADPDA